MKDFFYVLTFKGQVFAGIIEGLALFVSQNNPISFVPFGSESDADAMCRKIWQEQAVMTFIMFSDVDEQGHRFVESLDVLAN